MKWARSNAFAISFAILLTILCPRSNATVVTFENYAEGGKLPSPFTDLPTGVTFSNPQRGASSTTFNIEYGTARAGVPMLPGHYLVGTGYVPGDSISTATNFGFDASLPSGAAHVSMDVIFNSTSGSVTLTGFDSTGLPVATSTISPVGSFLQTQISIDAPPDSIHSLSVRATGDLSAGYDNITFTPEPSSATLALGLLALAARRRKR